MLTVVRNLTGIYLGSLMIHLHHSSLPSLLNFFADEHGFSKTVIGLINSATYLGMFIGCILFVRLVKRVSYIRTFAIAAAGTSIAGLVTALTLDAGTWFGMRVLGGLCTGTTMVLCESWLNQVTDKETKGRFYAIYVMVTYVGLGIGQLLLYLTDHGQHLGMTISTIASILALIPVCFSRFPEPVVNPESRQLTYREAFQISRLSFVGIFLLGATLATSSLVVVFGRGLELTQDLLVVVTVLMLVSNILFQLPAGMLSDRMGDRRRTIKLFCVVTVPISFVIGVAGEFLPWPVLIGLIFAYAGLVPTLYPMCMSLATDLASRDNIAPLVNRLYQVYAVGAVVGPALAGVLMDLFSTHWLFVSNGIFLTVLLLLCASSRFMPQLQPLETGPYVGVGPLASMTGTGEQLEMQTVDPDEQFMGPPEPDTRQGDDAEGADPETQDTTDGDKGRHAGEE